jgi:4-amino-4-deoxy-L-arabinose transferase-like glycosyltransferase
MLPIILIIILFFLFCLLNLNPLLRVDGGDAYSVILAKSLINNFTYNNIHLPGSPPHTKFPPLFPLILTPLIHFVGGRIEVLKIVNICFGIGSIITIYCLSLLFFKKEKAIFTALLFCLSPLIEFR